MTVTITQTEFGLKCGNPRCLENGRIFLTGDRGWLETVAEREPGHYVLVARVLPEWTEVAS